MCFLSPQFWWFYCDYHICSCWCLTLRLLAPQRHLSMKPWISFVFDTDSKLLIPWTRILDSTSLIINTLEKNIWFRGLPVELGFPQTEPTTVYADNSSMITPASNFSGNYSKVKHFILRTNFLIDHVLASLFMHPPSRILQIFFPNRWALQISNDYEPYF